MGEILDGSRPRQCNVMQCNFYIRVKNTGEGVKARKVQYDAPL